MYTDSRSRESIVELHPYGRINGWKIQGRRVERGKSVHYFENESSFGYAVTPQDIFCLRVEQSFFLCPMMETGGLEIFSFDGFFLYLVWWLKRKKWKKERGKKWEIS